MLCFTLSYSEDETEFGEPLRFNVLERVPASPSAVDDGEEDESDGHEQTGRAGRAGRSRRSSAPASLPSPLLLKTDRGKTVRMVFEPPQCFIEPTELGGLDDDDDDDDNGAASDQQSDDDDDDEDALHPATSRRKAKDKRARAQRKFVPARDDDPFYPSTSRLQTTKEKQRSQVEPKSSRSSHRQPVTAPRTRDEVVAANDSKKSDRDRRRRDEAREPARHVREERKPSSTSSRHPSSTTQRSSSGDYFASYPTRYDQRRYGMDARQERGLSSNYYQSSTAAFSKKASFPNNDKRNDRYEQAIEPAQPAPAQPETVRPRQSNSNFFSSLKNKFSFSNKNKASTAAQESSKRAAERVVEPTDPVRKYRKRPERYATPALRTEATASYPTKKPAPDLAYLKKVQPGVRSKVISCRTTPRKDERIRERRRERRETKHRYRKEESPEDHSSDESADDSDDDESGDDSDYDGDSDDESSEDETQKFQSDKVPGMTKRDTKKSSSSRKREPVTPRPSARDKVTTRHGQHHHRSSKAQEASTKTSTKANNISYQSPQDDHKKNKKKHHHAESKPLPAEKARKMRHVASPHKRNVRLVSASRSPTTPVKMSKAMKQPEKSRKSHKSAGNRKTDKTTKAKVSKPVETDDESHSSHSSDDDDDDSSDASEPSAQPALKSKTKDAQQTGGENSGEEDAGVLPRPQNAKSKHAQKTGHKDQRSVKEQSEPIEAPPEAPSHQPQQRPFVPSFPRPVAPMAGPYLHHQQQYMYQQPQQFQQPQQYVPPGAAGVPPYWGCPHHNYPAVAPGACPEMYYQQPPPYVQPPQQAPAPGAMNNGATAGNWQDPTAAASTTQDQQYQHSSAPPVPDVASGPSVPVSTNDHVSSSGGGVDEHAENTEEHDSAPTKDEPVVSRAQEEQQNVPATHLTGSGPSREERREFLATCCYNCGRKRDLTFQAALRAREQRGKGGGGGGGGGGGISAAATATASSSSSSSSSDQKRMYYPNLCAKCVHECSNENGSVDPDKVRTRFNDDPYYRRHWCTGCGVARSKAFHNKYKPGMMAPAGPEAMCYRCDEKRAKAEAERKKKHKAQNVKGEQQQAQQQQQENIGTPVRLRTEGVRFQSPGGDYSPQAYREHGIVTPLGDYFDTDAAAAMGTSQNAAAAATTTTTATTNNNGSNSSSHNNNNNRGQRPGTPHPRGHGNYRFPTCEDDDEDEEADEKSGRPSWRPKLRFASPVVDGQTFADDFDRARHTAGPMHNRPPVWMDEDEERREYELGVKRDRAADGDARSEGSVYADEVDYRARLVPTNGDDNDAAGGGCPPAPSPVDQAFEQAWKDAATVAAGSPGRSGAETGGGGGGGGGATRIWTPEKERERRRQEACGGGGEWIESAFQASVGEAWEVDSVEAAEIEEEERRRKLEWEGEE